MRLGQFGPLSEAERKVVNGLGSGQVTVLGDGDLPGPEAGDDRRVRASLIRWLALGAPGEDGLRLHEKGLRIAGALVVSDGQRDSMLKGESTPGLDLQECKLDHDLLLLGCRFQDAPVLLGARVQTLFLISGYLPGLIADRLQARGSILLRHLQANGEVRLPGARIGGSLSCVRARLENTGGKALTADGIETRGGVLLRYVQAKGEVSLVGARIGGNLDCDHGRFEKPLYAGKDGSKSDSPVRALTVDGMETQGSVFLRGVQCDGEVRLPGAQIRGNLDCVGGRFENAGGTALNAGGARVSGAFFWRKGSQAVGALDLTAAEIGHITDDPACWPAPGDLLLNRCRYGAFTGRGISAAERIRWLDIQNPARFGHDFWPQPWEHCAKVLREMGHAEDARQVLIAKEARQRAARRARVARTLRGKMLWPLLWLGDTLLGALIAYGHRPRWAMRWLVLLAALGWGVFGAVWERGAFKPNNAFILGKPEWAGCEAGGDRRGEQPSTLACYLAQPEAAGYPRFNGLVYSLDTLVPVVDLEVQDHWVPDARAAPWARWYLWLHIASGWFLALLAVAGFSGLVQTKATEE